MKKNLLSIIILALLVVNIVLSAIMMISVSSATKKTASLVADIATVIGLEIEGLPDSNMAATVPMADTEVYNISSELTIPLKTGEDGKSHYAVGNVSLSMNSAHEDYETYSATMEAKEGLIKDIIFSVMANYTMEEAKTNSAAIKSEILQGIQTLFDSDFVYGISFSFLYS
ncbi:MAG: flagellar basal body-associated FliL family protein [Lachnospiraceae bacterium]|nr:flagellar basal body-associated FliL family protein [Lachnospiraceae bacterium]